MKVILLPGMDGTGVLFEPFLEAIPAGIDVVTMPLKRSAQYTYTDHARDLMQHIGNDPSMLVAESYSGMIAYELLRMGCSNIKHVVFAASFITRPSALAAFAQYLPLTLLKNKRVPRALLGNILFGRFSSNHLIDEFYHALDLIEVAVLKQRLLQISCLQQPVDTIAVPCTYIRPSDDKLVSPDVIKSFQQLCNDLEIHEIAGTHFVLQTNPSECWKIIQNILT